ncbi:GTPase family protein [Spirulina subsalsa FACHB-351]|uniref:GTPase family protein n=1 Tax=Spirulina subsalsa FACHB-351 TaxID=234711 RepID=A0ABT3LAW2_9CYAN|nr:GTPase family protein [Spirulina subsalsa]MCW6038625.1 GTPase family protein [Spirulina subsalsa FACHB-351]
MRLKPWQWIVLITPITVIVLFLLIAAGTQIHDWRLNWIWAVFTLLLVGWRWLLVRWTKPLPSSLETPLVAWEQSLDSPTFTPEGRDQALEQVERVLQGILAQAQSDRPLWEDMATFWERCREVVVQVAQVYHPEVQYPILNIYIPQAYGLMRSTVEDVDCWMEQLSPALNQVTVGQAYQAYALYQKLEPSARKALRVWNWAQWLLNPAAAAARMASQGTNQKATQQLLVNLGQMVRETALRNLARQAAALYGGQGVPNLETAAPPPGLAKAKTTTLQAILEAAEPTERLEQKPLNLLFMGRTGAGKTSLINSLFESEQGEVDVLPSTDQIKSYHWETPQGDSLTLWDTPGYEQVNQREFRAWVLEAAQESDLLLLVTPALDPALQMDGDLLQEIHATASDLPILGVVTQVDKLRPLREWEPPYDWQNGDRPKEKNIRAATQYRGEQLAAFCGQVLPVVTQDWQTGRSPWNIDTLSVILWEAIAPTQQIRLARFLRDRETRIIATAKLIDRYTLQMTTTQGLTALLKSPILQFLSTLTTGSPALAYLLAEQIPVEQLPVVIGKLQLAYDLYNLLGSKNTKSPSFDLLALWPLLLENNARPDQEAWAFGHALVEYWTQPLSLEQTEQRYQYYLKNFP